MHGTAHPTSQHNVGYEKHSGCRPGRLLLQPGSPSSSSATPGRADPGRSSQHTLVQLCCSPPPGTAAAPRLRAGLEDNVRRDSLGWR